MKYLTPAAPADYALVQRSMGTITAKYPFVCKVPLGRSPKGREIDTLMLCCPGKRQSGRVLLTAAQCGEEWISTLVLLRFCEEVCYCLQNGLSMVGVDVRRALTGRTVLMIPQVNPDGVEAVLHGEKDLLPDFSAVHALCSRLRLRHTSVLHGNGNCIRWQHGENTPVPAHMMAEIMASASGLTATDTQDERDGFCRWFVSTFSGPAFSVDLGEKENPPPIEHVPAIGKRVRELLLLNCML